MSKNPYVKTELKYFLHTFKRWPLFITKAKGIYVWDKTGKKYIDFFSGLAVCGVGHVHPRVKAAIQKQADRLLHVSNYFYTQPLMDAAKELTGRYQGTKVFFSNSGAEANEAAVKFARLWAAKTNKKGREIITFSGSFHGRTLAMVAASDPKNRSNGVFAPYPTGFRHCRFNDLIDLRKAVNSKTIAIMLEPIQGEGGINIASRPFMKEIVAQCRKNNLLLIMDEVQSGIARTGTFFAFEQYGIKPDIVTLAKGLAGGLPLGATLATAKVAKHVVPGLHGSTFGGNPVSCAAALEVLKMLTAKNGVLIRQTGRILNEELSSFASYPSVKEIRCFGLMAAIELHGPGDAYVEAARRKGLIINCTRGNVLRFLPPYFISKRELVKCIQILKLVFEELN